MKTSYKIVGYSAFSELYNCKNGYYSKPQHLHNSNYSIESESFDVLLDILKSDFKGILDTDFILNSCESGRLDLKVYQAQVFNKAMPSVKTLESWKAGELDLYLTWYTFHVIQVTEELDLKSLTLRKCS